MGLTAPILYHGRGDYQSETATTMMQVNYHQPTDTSDTLDYEFMAEVGELLVNVVEKAQRS